MSIYKWIAFLPLVFGLQVLVKNYFFQVNFALAIVYIFSIKTVSERSGFASVKPEAKSTLFGVTVGLAEDALSGSIIGPAILSKGLAGYLSCTAFSDLIFKWTPLWGALAIGLLTLLDGFVIVTMRNIFSGLSISGPGSFASVFYQALINLPFGLFVRAGSAR
ncbi:MAG: hypothetical protein LLF86_04420 [Nitrospiraceae bacterium]|nr:hypothetical protein [Nitrospiraceae bacterium]